VCAGTLSLGGPRRTGTAPLDSALGKSFTTRHILPPHFREFTALATQTHVARHAAARCPTVRRLFECRRYHAPPVSGHDALAVEALLEGLACAEVNSEQHRVATMLAPTASARASGPRDEPEKQLPLEHLQLPRRDHGACPSCCEAAASRCTPEQPQVRGTPARHAFEGGVGGCLGRSAAAHRAAAARGAASRATVAP